MLVRVVRQVAADEGLFPDVALTVTYVDDGDIRELNREHRAIDRVVYVLCALAFAVSAFVVLRTELGMFLPGGGAA